MDLLNDIEANPLLQFKLDAFDSEFRLSQSRSNALSLSNTMEGVPIVLQIIQSITSVHLIYIQFLTFSACLWTALIMAIWRTYASRMGRRLIVINRAKNCERSP